MISGNTDLFEAPIRTITGAVELLGGSTATLSGKTLDIDEVYPVSHDIKISARSENLLDLNTVDTGSYGIPRVEGNNVVVEPTSSNNFYYIGSPSIYQKLEVGETYTFSMDSVSGHGGSWGWRFRYVNGTYSTVNKKTSLTIKWTDNISWVQFYFGMPYTSTEPIICENLQVRKADTVLPFVPYVDTSDVAITATGRNLFLCNDFELPGKYLSKTCKNGVISLLPTGGLSTTIVVNEENIPFAEWLPNQYLEPNTYTFTGEWLLIRDADKNKRIYLELLLDDGTSDTIYSGETKTFTQRAKIVAVMTEKVAVANQGDPISCRLMLERGTEAHPYEKAFEYKWYQGGVISTKINNVYVRASDLPETANLQITYQAPYRQSFTADGELKEVVVNRAGESKFFGFGISQKATIKLLDKERKYNIDKGTIFCVGFNDVRPMPDFYADEVKRNENTNEIEIVAYDALKRAANFTIKDLGIENYTIMMLAQKCADIMSLDDVVFPSINEFAINYPEGGNYSGTETIREVLNHIAEATQTFYFINSNNFLEFRRLDRYGNPVLTIGKDKYFTLEASAAKTLTGICSATELGDNLSTGEGLTQYVWNNPLWDNREDRATLVENALTAVKNTVIVPYKCKWRGNYLLEPGDKIGVVGKDNGTIQTYLINDTLTYNGGMSQDSSLEYEETDAQPSNPTTLGEALKNTFAKVDKINNEITMVASQTSENKEAISTLQINSDSINASVSTLEKQMDSVSGSMTEISKKVEATMTDEEINIAIENKLSNGVSSVETATGFTFNETGLTVSKSNSDISTTITEDGMKVSKGSNEVLVANNEGVKAIDLHAETYLLIGKNSRFEDYNYSRTGCFWIGG